MTLLERLLLNKLATKKLPTISVHDDYSESTTEPYSANYVNTELNKKFEIENNAAAHNSIYRGRNITDLFYDGTLSTQIAAGTFDDIFIGDYIIGENSNTKYIVADINYCLNTGDTECTTNHVLMIPDKIMGTDKMNASDTTSGGYPASAMRTTALTSYKTTITNDFGSSHILTHRTYLTATNADSAFETSGTYYDSTADLMNEIMVYGCNIFHNQMNGTTLAGGNATLDNSQLALFRLNKSKIIATDENNDRQWYWLRDVASNNRFCMVFGVGRSDTAKASSTAGVRPAFLIY